MYRYSITTILLLISTLLFAQGPIKPKVFIEPSEKIEGWLNAALTKKGSWTVVGAQDESNVIFRTTVAQRIGIATVKLFIIDSQTKETIWTSEPAKGMSTAFNGYSPKKAAIENLVDNLESKFDKKTINLTHIGNGESAAKSTGKASVADELLKLKGLLDSGAITKEEYEGLKKKLLE